MAFGACSGVDLIVDLSGWSTVYDPFDTSVPAHIVTGGDPDFPGGGGGGGKNDFEIVPTEDWAINATFQYSDVFNIAVGMASSAGDVDEVRFALIGLGVGNDEWFLTTNGDDDGSGTYSEVFDENTDIDLELVWDQVTTTLTATLTQGDHTETLSSFDPYDAGGTPPYHPFIVSSFAADTAIADFTYFCMVSSDEGGPTPSTFSQVIFIGI